MVKFFHLGFCLNNHMYHSNKIISILYRYNSFYMPGILLLKSGHNQMKSCYYTLFIDGELEAVWDHVIAQGHSWYVVQPELSSYKWSVISWKHIETTGPGFLCPDLVSVSWHGVTNYFFCTFTPQSAGLDIMLYGHSLFWWSERRTRATVEWLQVPIIPSCLYYLRKSHLFGLVKIFHYSQCFRD